ncbi:MAG: GAF domain-containing protein [Elainellaceae cyanobacterium]
MPQPIPHPSRYIPSLEALLHRMTNRIRQSIELPDILDSTVTEVRAFLKTDRVKIYRFHSDGSGEVIAESIRDQTLPSLIGHRFPAEDIPDEARDLFLKARQRTIVDVRSGQIGVSPLVCHKTKERLSPTVQMRPVDSCHIEYLTHMGVQSSLVVPILHENQLWGLLVSHHASPRTVSQHELKIVQLVADQVSVAIAHSTLLNQTRLQAQQEACVNRVTALLHSTSEMQFQQALDHTVASLQGIGGRIYFEAQHPNQAPEWFSSGQIPSSLPVPSPLETQNKYSSCILEQHPYWQMWLDHEQLIQQDNKVRAIADLYISDIPSDIAAALLSVQIRGVLVVCLRYQQQLLGYLSIFRGEIDIENIWAGRLDDRDPRQLRPRQSFETWREIKHNQAHEWTPTDIELAQSLGDHFAMAIHQYQLYRQIQALNVELEQHVLKRTIDLQRTNVELKRKIYEHERALDELHQAKNSIIHLSYQNELILSSAGEGIYGLDPSGEITFVNPAAARILGYETDDLLGQFMHSLVHHVQPDGTLYEWNESPIYSTLKKGTIQHITDELFQRRDGSTIPIEYVSTPMQDRGVILGAVIVFKDITERKLVEQMKDEFVSVVSHELRTPLTSIRAALGLLARGDLNAQLEKKQRMLDIAFSNANRLVRLVNDILDVERIKLGKVSLNKQRCNIADLIPQAVDVMSAMADKFNIELTATSVSANVWADPDRIIQTLTNLLSNAIKFSPRGSTVWITADVIHRASLPNQLALETTPISHPFSSQEPSNAAPDIAPHALAQNASPVLLIAVKDQGRGIPEEKLDIVFDRFQQLNISDSGHKGGTGLGLAICRSIAQEHGGQIWAENISGQGSIFYFMLPLLP